MRIFSLVCGLALLSCAQPAAVQKKSENELGHAGAAAEVSEASGTDEELARKGGFHGCEKAQRATAPGPGMPAAPGEDEAKVKRRVQLQILVVSADDVGTQMVKAGLKEGLVPCVELDLTDSGRPIIDAAFLSDWLAADRKRGRFQAVVLPNQAPTQLSAAELQALADYEREFGVRELASYVFPSWAVGLEPPAYEGPLDGMTAQLTAAGKAGAFAYLAGELPFDDTDPKLAETSGYLSAPQLDDGARARSFTALVDMPIPGKPSERGVLLGVYRADGREQLVITAAMNQYQLHQQALFPGILSWLTYGVHLGAERNYFSVHVDDIFLPNARWSMEANCTLSSSCDPRNAAPKIAMTAQDIDYLRSWQDEHHMMLDLLFNGSGYDRAVAQGPFPLGERLLAQRDAFRFVSHTYNHLYLGCTEDFSVTPARCAPGANGEISWTAYQDVYDQIVKNQAFARRVGLAIRDDELVTGEHSGLRRAPQEPSDNPSLARALTAAGVRWIASDGSRETAQRQIGSALTAPRYPMNIYYDAATKAETIDEYNYIYTSAADGGSGECEHNPKATCAPALEDEGFEAYLVPHEARDVMRHIVSNVPWAHFVHQSNLAEERVLYPVLERVLTQYRALFAPSADIVNASLSELGRELMRQAEWAAADSSVNAYIEDGELRLEGPDDSSTSTPLTLPEDADVSTAEQSELAAYGGALVGWCTVTGSVQRLRLPEQVAYRTR